MTDRFKDQIERINHLIDTLLTAVYAQGKDGRDCDDEEGTAQAADDALMACIRAALSDAYEAGRREEREACLAEVLKLKRHQIEKDVWVAYERRVPEIAAAIRSREAGE